MFAVIRIRGSTTISRKILDTLNMLRLNDANNCIIIPETADYKGMIETVHGWCTWGEVDRETLIAMLEKRLRLKGNKKIDGNILKPVGFSSFEAFADDLISGKVRLKDFPQFQPMFRLTPPSKGFKAVNEYYPKGDLGYRKKEINELIMRMI